MIATKIKPGTELFQEKNGRFHQCTALSDHPEFSAITVRKGGEEWIIKREGLLSVGEVAALKYERKQNKKREQYQAVIEAVKGGAKTHLQLAEKLKVLPMVAWQWLKACRRWNLVP